MFAYLAQGLTLGLSGAVSPGPFQAYLISQSLKIGWRRTLPVALAPLISDGPIIALVLVAFSAFPPVFLRIIQIVGGAFVLMLAWKSYQSYRAFVPAQPAAEQGEKSLFRAVLTNFLSPGPYLFWSLLAGPSLLRGWNEDPSRGIAFVVGFYAAMVGTLAALIVTFGAARSFGPRVHRALMGLSTLALAGFGVYQIWQGAIGG